jgi:hypothetical protein
MTVPDDESVRSQGLFGGLHGVAARQTRLLTGGLSESAIEGRITEVDVTGEWWLHMDTSASSVRRAFPVPRFPGEDAR